MRAHPPTASTVSDFAVLRARGTSPGKQFGDGAAVGLRQVVQSSCFYGLAAAHLQGPRFIVHRLDHLLSPVRTLYQIRKWPDTTSGYPGARGSSGRGRAASPTAPMARR